MKIVKFVGAKGFFHRNAFGRAFDTLIFVIENNGLVYLENE